MRSADQRRPAGGGGSEGEAEFLAVAAELGLQLAPIGELVERQSLAVQVL
ncbi:hypothetical protein P4114_27820 [Pseudomonas aeruginosa]|nr:hypothetical protein [Pseudomonas aeruginosa]